MSLTECHLLHIFQKVSPPTNFEQQKPFIYQTILLCKDIKVMTVGISISIYFGNILQNSPIHPYGELFNLRSATASAYV